jgi:hypothetical protein
MNEGVVELGILHLSELFKQPPLLLRKRFRRELVGD